MNWCQDCGEKMSGEICPNCHEELYILAHQGKDMDGPVSDEFMDKAQKQAAEIRKKESETW